MNKLVGHVKKVGEGKDWHRVLVLGAAESEDGDGDDAEEAVSEPEGETGYAWHDLDSTSQVDYDELAELLRFSSDNDDGASVRSCSQTGPADEWEITHLFGSPPYDCGWRGQESTDDTGSILRYLLSESGSSQPASESELELEVAANAATLRTEIVREPPPAAIEDLTNRMRSWGLEGIGDTFSVVAIQVSRPNE